MEKTNSFKVTRINSLKLSNFRNHRNLNIETNKNFVLFYGPNGSGKTNVLEAISLLSSKTGFRSPNLISLVKDFDKNKIIEFGISAKLTIDNNPTDIGVGLINKNDKITKYIKFQKNNSRKKLESILKIFWILPDMNNLFQSSSRKRRNFIDSMIASYNDQHEKRIKIYENLQKQRINILKGFSLTPKNNSWLDVIERKMASQGVIICEKRMNLFESLNQILLVKKENLPNVKIKSLCKIEEKLQTMPALKIEEEITSKLFDNRKIDGLIGKTKYSAINSDFKIDNLDKNTDAQNCSTGEQKVILLSLFFSFIRLLKKYGITRVIFLLDDIFSNLDNKYAEMILKSLWELDTQTWITDIGMNIIKKGSDLYRGTKFINIEDIKMKN